MARTAFITLPALTLILVSSLTWQTVHSSSKIDFYTLYNDYFTNTSFYNKNIRPANDQNEALRVYMDFRLLSILDVDEKQQMLETSARLLLAWDDDYLSWDPATYGGIDQLMVPQKVVYVPDIVLGNSISSQERIGYDQLPVRVYSDGTVIWEPTLYLSTDCDIDITYFPFETQACTIDFETAISTSREIDIDVSVGKTAIDLQDFAVNGQWELHETSSENLFNENSKTKIRFSLVIKRRRTFYILNILLPVMFLSLTSSLVFAIPAEEGEKMGTGITVLLAFAVYLTIVSDLIPNTSLHVSILGMYLTILLGLSAISVVICAANLRLHNRGDDRPVGPCTDRITRFLRYMMCFNDNHDPSTTAKKETPISRSRASSQRPKSAQSDHSRARYDPPTIPTERIRLPRIHSIQIPHPPIPRHTSPIPPPAPGPEYEEEKENDSMTWKTVAQTLDWFCFLFFTMCTFAVTLISILWLHFGSIENAPSL